MYNYAGDEDLDQRDYIIDGVKIKDFAQLTDDI
jgi:hypothetical protein